MLLPEGTRRMIFSEHIVLVPSWLPAASQKTSQFSHAFYDMGCTCLCQLLPGTVPVQYSDGGNSHIICPFHVMMPIPHHNDGIVYAKAVFFHYVADHIGLGGPLGAKVPIRSADKRKPGIQLKMLQNPPGLRLRLGSPAACKGSRRLPAYFCPP